VGCPFSWEIRSHWCEAVPEVLCPGLQRKATLSCRNSKGRPQYEWRPLASICEGERKTVVYDTNLGAGRVREFAFANGPTMTIDQDSGKKIALQKSRLQSKHF